MKTVLRYEDTAEHIYSKLKDIPRTGWVMRDVSNPETVYDHTVSLIQLAAEVGTEANLTTDQIDDLKHILEVHDWAEALAGDEFIEDNQNKISYEEKKQIKAERELKALAELLQGQAYEVEVLRLFKRYETGADTIAKLAKELDKYQALELALHYEQQQGIALFEEFYTYYKRDWPFSHPVILKRIESLVAEHNQATRAKV